MIHPNLRRALALAWVLTLMQNMNAQRTCGMDSVHAHLMGLAGYEEAFREKVQAVNEAVGQRLDCDNPLIIPVAVHFQNTGIPIDCAIEMALSQVEVLNQDFSATNPDITEWEDQQPTLWPGIQNQESCIQFCLATLNHPAGFGLQDGDYAVTLDATNGDFDANWAGYLNFFVRSLGGGVLGYSPLGGQGNGDGATCDPAYFGAVSCGGNAVNPPYDMGRTMTHEIGHYLLLDHPWANGGCGSNDFVGDTPVTDGPQFGCPSGQSITTCVEPILWPTYMEYCDDACLFMFSAGQVARMETYVEQNLAPLLNGAATVCQEAACVGFNVDAVAVAESCAGGDGQIALTPDGGTAPYAFTLAGSAAATGSFTGLTEGTYSAVVEDAAGCAWAAEVDVVRAAPAVALESVVNEYCSDAAGAIEVAVNEPTTFQYRLNGGPWQASGVFEGLSAGSYTVEVENAAGCGGEVAATLVNESNLAVAVTRRDISCDWINNGALDVRVMNGTEPVTYLLDGTIASETGLFQGLAPGLHEVAIADAAGCTFTAQYTLTYDYASVGDDCPCMVYVPTAFTPNNDGHNDAFGVESSCPLTNYHLRIFDRWGRVVFESADPTAVWVGGDTHWVQSDYFAYTLTYSWGTEEAGGAPAERVSGTFVVIR